jgi:hypothetical protein
MIDAPALKADLQKQVKDLEADLRRRLKSEPDFAAPLQAKYDVAFQARRTAAPFGTWADEQITQSAVAWVLATVFIRFLEDNGFLPDPILSGPGERRRLAQDALSHHFQQRPADSEREYLLHHYEALRQYPALTELLGPHNALHALHPGPDVLKGLIAFWREIDPVTGILRHDFTDPAMNTRFLGDLYQDLSEAARKTYALLQTPDFIESFILDRTLTPAIREFGLKTVRLIDPTCGSGHFLLGTFRRLFALWLKEVPTAREAAVNALQAVHGVDLNPFAVAISRFRLIIEACHACGVSRLADAPDFPVNVAVGDSLLHGRRFRAFESESLTQPTLPGSEDPAFADELKHHYEVEDAEALHRILGQQYHAVVGNPPYITVKDAALSKLYRARFPSCHRQYSLSVPFMERFFDLAVKGDGTPQQPAGFVGQITSNSFMKREFGRKLIEEYLPRWDLTHVLDTSGAYIPGHGTPTVILFGKNQPPVSGTIRTVLSIAGEPATPNEPALGLVWQAIVRQIDEPGSVSEWVSAADSPRTNFHRHPWSIGGGGAAELKEAIDAACDTRLERFFVAMGRIIHTGGDEAYFAPRATWSRFGIPHENVVCVVEGDEGRDWQLRPETETLFPYDGDLKASLRDAKNPVLRQLWLAKSILVLRREPGGTHAEIGLTWFEWSRFQRERFIAPRLLCFAEIATHNHFTIDQGGKVFKQTAPIIQLKSDATEEEHVRLLGVLNSSTACFWLRQVCFPKGGDHQGSEGARVRTTIWDERFAFNGTQVANLPIPAHQPTQLPTALVQTSTALQAQSPAATLASWRGPESDPLHTRLATARDQATRLRRQLIAWQEELDWQIYETFGLVEGAAASGPAAVSLPEGEAMDRVAECGLELGERAFEIVLARRLAAGEVQTAWFKRHGSTPLTELPRHWPAAYRKLVERRIALIADDPSIRLIEQPEYKRRWNTEPWDEQFQRAARDWLLARLETYFFDSERMDGSAASTAQRQSWLAGQEPKIFSLAQLVAVAETDAALKEVMQEYTGTPTFDLTRQIRELLEEGSVPYLPVLRYKETGLRKRQAWEETWVLQRREDAIEADVRAQNPGSSEDALKPLIREAQKKQVGEIPVPPKYASVDFKKAGWWKLRGKLDVPKERWVSYPKLESDAAPSPLYAWAGWTHLQQVQALAELYVERKDRDGWDAARLTPILAGLQELVPWLQQWHNEEDPVYGLKLGDYYADYVNEERRALGLTLEILEEARLGV